MLEQPAEARPERAVERRLAPSGMLAVVTVAELIGTSPGITAVREQVARLVGRHGSGRLPTVLLEGETGTGKGLLARALHAASPRRAGPFVEVNCAAIPETLLEAELFGVERGAFTGADRARPGLFQAADGGTLFLDEIALVPDALQSKLLKAVEERTVRRLGRTASERVDVWVLAATNEDLEAAVQAKRFRRDLYHRLAVVTLRLPPLRERGGDVDLLAEHFLARVCADYGLPRKTLHEAARAALRAHRWPGNVRELGNAMERAGLLSEGSILTAEALALGEAPGERPAAGPAAHEAPLRALLDGAERDLVMAALEETAWSLSRAAARLEIPRNTLRYRMERFGLRAPPPSRRRAGPPEPSAPPPAAPAEGDRRRISWLRADLTAAAEAHRGTSRALAEVADKVRAFGGRIQAASQGRIVAAFGLEPIEDAPRRAALAALAIQKASERAREDRAGPWSVAVALHVADGAVASGTPSVIEPGGALEAAAALDAIAAGAAGDTVRVSGAMGRALERRFEVRAVADGPAAAYELRGREHSGFRVRGRVTPFVGRAADLAWLEARLPKADEGRGQVVGIVGEAGIGKSRLVAQLRRAPAAQRATWLEGRCIAYAMASPYQPIAAVVRQLCGVEDAHGPEAVAARLAAAVVTAGLDAREVMPYLRDLLGAPGGAPSGVASGMSPEMVRTRTFEAVRSLLLQTSRAQPVALVIEDAHWIDETSDSLLGELVEGMMRAPMLLLLTYRPGYRPRWLQRSYAAQLSLDPLPDEESREVVRAMLVARPAPELVEAILARGEGNPFFLEELSRALADERGATGTPVVPGTVRDVLAGRMAKLDDADRRVLQTAAVIGRDVADDLLRAVADESADVLGARLARLQAAEFLRLIDIGPHPAYAFQHALTHEVAYDSLLPESRRRLHGRVADALEAKAEGNAAADDERLARHALGAERWGAAVRYLRRAADQALARSANREAVALVEQALGALERLPEDGERSRRELTLQITRGVALIALDGYGAPAVARTYERARELCRQVGQTPRLLGAHLGLWVFHLFRGDVEVSRELADQCLAVVTPYPESPLLGWAHLAAGLSAFWRADFARARAELEQSVALYDVEEQAPLATVYGQDCGVTSLAYLAVLLSATLADADRAIRHAADALALAERVAHPYTTAGALTLTAAAHLLRREPGPARERAEAAVEVATEQGFPVWRTMAMVLRGWAVSEAGQGDEGIDEMRRGITAWRGLGSQLAAPWFLTLLAEALARRDRLDEGLEAVAEALDAAARDQDRWYVPETHRVHGELLRRRGQRAEAEAAVRRGAGLARRQGVTALEVRAALTLGHLHLAHGDRGKARRVLADACDLIPEGVATPDAAAARALLAALS